MKFIFFLTISLSTIFIFLNHPLSLGIILLTQTILISLMTGTMNNNFWYSYMIFLIMIGGMLILFIYMTSVASNEKFKFNPKFLFLIKSTMILIFMMMFLDSFIFNLNFNMTNFSQINNLSLSKFINSPNNMIIFLIILYLLISLIMVVKITNINYGPLRQKN
nr:NADH dehydrogenase subunit 6 [Peithona prionoides]